MQQETPITGSQTGLLSSGVALVRGLSRAWLWAAGAVLLLFCGYVLAGFFLVPGLIRSQAVGWVKTNLDKSLALGEIRFNPFTLTADVSDIAIPDAGGPIVAAGHLKVDVSALSLFALLGRPYVFDAVRLDRPFVRAVIRPDRSLNLIALVPKTRSKGPSPTVRITTLSVDRGEVDYADHSRDMRPEEKLRPITFTLDDFQTNSTDGGAFTLRARSEQGEGFTWTGTLSSSPLASRGRLTVSHLLAGTIQKFFADMMPVVLTAGQIGFTADYDFAYRGNGIALNGAVPDVTLAGLSFDGRKGLFNGSVKLNLLNGRVSRIALAAGGGAITKFEVTLPRVTLQGMSLAPPGAAPEQGMRLANALLDNAKLDYGARRIEMDAVTLDGADLFARRDRRGRINLAALMPEKAAAPGGNAPAAQSWKISLGTFTLNAASVRIEDEAVAPATHLSIAPLNATVTGSGSDLSQPMNVRFDARMNGAASAAGEALITPADGKGDLKFTLTKLPARAFAGYMPRMQNLDLRSGEIGASGRLHFEGGNLAALRFQGDASLDNFNMLETTTNSPLFAWRSFAFKAINYRKDNVEIGGARLTRPLGRVAVLANRQFNFTSLMAARPAPGATGTVPIQAAPAAAPTRPALTFRLRRLDISRGVMGFADYSIEPNFEARVDELQGSIANITNRPGEVAAIDLTGQVIDRFSPVTIKGTMDLLGYDRKTDMHLAFRNIELPVFNPYSGRYAGYAIAKGKLTTELSYKIDNRALKADHHVIIDQLEWGAETDSKERVPLPIRLATALLKDRNGVIDLNLPVTGSLDDPKFRIGPIIWQIIGNILEKVVTAPFALIGSLFAGAEKAQYVDFAQGSAALPPGSGDSLGALAKALGQRPELKLDIPAGPAGRDDANGIADAQIDALLMAKESRKGAPADVSTLDADEQHDRLEDLYRARAGKKPVFPEFSADALKNAPGAKADADDDDRRTLLESQWLRSELRTSFAPSAAQLAALGTARATAVRDALLADGTVDPSRVFMETAMTATANNGHSRLELKLK